MTEGTHTAHVHELKPHCEVTFVSASLERSLAQLDLIRLSLFQDDYIPYPRIEEVSVSLPRITRTQIQTGMLQSMTVRFYFGSGQEIGRASCRERV